MARDFAEFNKILSIKRARIEFAEESNKEREELLEQNKLLTKAHEDLSKRLEELKLLKKHISIAIERYEDRAINILTQDIQNALYLVFPDEDFKVKIKFLNLRGSTQAILHIGKYIANPVQRAAMGADEEGYYWDIPQMQNGSLFKQVVSFASQVSIIQMLGGTCIMLDEAFSKGDSKSLGELSPYLTMLHNNGFQIIGIEHKSEIYDNIPHKQYKFMKDRIGDRIKIASVENIKGPEIGNIAELGYLDTFSALKELQSMPGFGMSMDVVDAVMHSDIAIEDLGDSSREDTTVAEMLTPDKDTEESLKALDFRHLIEMESNEEKAEESKSENGEGTARTVVEELEMVPSEKAVKPVDNDIPNLDFDSLFGSSDMFEEEPVASEVASVAEAPSESSTTKAPSEPQEEPLTFAEKFRRKMKNRHKEDVIVPKISTEYHYDEAHEEVPMVEPISQGVEQAIELPKVDMVVPAVPEVEETKDEPEDDFGDILASLMSKAKEEVKPAVPIKESNNDYSDDAFEDLLNLI